MCRHIGSAWLWADEDVTGNALDSHRQPVNNDAPILFWGFIFLFVLLLEDRGANIRANYTYYVYTQLLL